MLTNRRELLVEFGDCDPSGIVFNPRFFVWFDGSLHALMRKAGLTFAGLKAEFGFDGFPLVETKAKFLAPCRCDDIIAIETTVAKLHRSAFDLQHRIYNGDVLAAEGYETRVWTVFDDQAKRIRSNPIPERIARIFGG